jgi:glycine betaine/proline transport system substrate-binding protein
MKSFKTLLATTATLGLACPALAFEPESTDTIKVMIADWPSIQIHAEILNIILSTYGYDVELVVADDSARYPGFEAGDLTIALETWQTTQEQAFNASVATGDVLDMGELGPLAKEDWWYPIYMKEQCPGLPNWEALKDCAKVFSSPDTAPNGRYCQVRSVGAAMMPSASPHWVCLSPP